MSDRPETLVTANGVELCSQTFGAPADPPILLVMGATASMLWWPDALCRRLATAGRFVIRYDHRDTGRSVTYPPGPPPYDLETLTADAAGVLDAHGVAAAHLVGMSLGGLIAQVLALSEPARVRTLTLIASEPLDEGDPDWPGIAPAIIEHHARAAELDWGDRAAVVDFMVGGWRLLSGPARPFDEPLIRDIASREVARARDPLSASNHAMLGGGERWYRRLGEVGAPTLVIHGTHDPVLPYAAGCALADRIAGAELITLEGAGHELHPLDWDVLVDAIVRHTAGATLELQRG